MSDGDGPRTLYLALLLLVTVGSVVGMRLSPGKAIRMSLAWIAIFAGMFMIFSFRGDFSALGSRLRAEATGAPIESGGQLRIPKADDGHFWVEASINGTPARFLIDSGATVTTISPGLARAAGVALDGHSTVIDTANGTATVDQAEADRLSLGPIRRDRLPIQVSRGDTVNVVGMNFLSTLAGWSVEGNYLVLRP